MINIGIIGFSEGNGHPYSFSAIINGYNKKEMKNSGWDVIYNYLELKDKSDFLCNHAKVTHIWTQDYSVSKKIALATKIDNICDDYMDMIGEIDAVIIARDDYKEHYKIAKPFLESDIYTFVDKPLSLDIDELKYFKPYLDSNKLMSCSGLRYACELDNIKLINEEFKLIRGTVINSMDKYGVHLLDGIFSIIDFNVISVTYIESNHESLILKNIDNSIIQIDALGNSEKTFKFDFWSDRIKATVEVNDNFIAFKRMIFRFIEMIKYNNSDINTELTLNIMKVLISFQISKKEKREVFLDEITI